MIFKNNKIYDILKYVALIVLPALAKFFLDFAEIWDIPNGAKIASTIELFAILLGALIGVSSYLYSKKGSDE